MSSHETSLFYKFFSRKKKEKPTQPTSVVVNEPAASKKLNLVINLNTVPDRKVDTNVSAAVVNRFDSTQATPAQKPPCKNSIINQSSSPCSTNVVSKEITNMISQSIEQSHFIKSFDAQPVCEQLDENLTPIKEEENPILRISEMASMHLNESNALNANQSMNGASNTAEILHNLNVTSYITPTYCDFCGQLLVGLRKQGLKCQNCKHNFHKQCIPHISRTCNEASHLKSDASKLKQIEIEHTFLKKDIYNIYRSYLKCDHCGGKFYSDKIYLQCQDCQVNMHKKCAKQADKNCKTSNDNMNNNLSNDQTCMEVDETNWSQDVAVPNDESSLENVNVQNNVLLEKMIHDEPLATEVEMSNQIDDQAPISGEIGSSSVKRNTKYRQQTNKSKKSTQICLQRISQRVKKTNGFFWSGHMFYYTDSQPEVVTNYWRLDSQSINIYNSYRLEKHLKEIPLASIRAANICGMNPNIIEEYVDDQKCLFTLVTDTETYYCGMGGSDNSNTMNVLARNFYNIFKMAYLPYGNLKSRRISWKISAPQYEEKNLEEEYIINPEELLGSGQFGQVYGGICRSNQQKVAIKVIDKSRFKNQKDFQNETSVFQNEITLLYNVNHPGIVRLYSLFDEVDNLYIVTEKMSGDMLEMILNKNPSRLNERHAKFIIYQILIALLKLHTRNIAHCDLKPENILLVSNSDFPHVKICDFGYAKIIGENSFRRSMVGTPAYSPPELKNPKRCYNNSIDMWSMGVIVYVSLSGTFPFEEDRDINEQIMNPNFMFPAEPWEFVSSDAINLINSFLQVKFDRRMSANKALNHRWFSEDQLLYQDLLDLEKRVNLKWLTTKEQENKWSQTYL